MKKLKFLSFLNILNFKSKKNIVLYSLMFLSILYPYIKKTISDNSHKQVGYNQSNIQLDSNLIDANYIKINSVSTSKFNFNQGILALFNSNDKNQLSNTQTNLLNFISEKQAILIHNLIGIDIYSSLLSNNYMSSINNNISKITKYTNYIDINSFISHPSSSYFLYGKLISDDCNEEYCNITLDNNNPLFNINIEIPQLSQDTYFICKNISKYTDKNLFFNNCESLKSFVKNNIIEITEILKTHPNYLKSNTKHLIYTALIAYYYINNDSLCYNQDIYLNQSDSQQCLKEISNAFQKNLNLKVDWYVFKNKSDTFGKILDIPNKTNQYYDLDLIQKILANIINKTNANSQYQKREIYNQLLKLYHPGDSFNSSPANNINNYNLDLIKNADFVQKQAESDRELREKLQNQYGTNWKEYYQK